MGDRSLHAALLPLRGAPQARKISGASGQSKRTVGLWGVWLVMGWASVGRASMGAWYGRIGPPIPPPSCLWHYDVWWVMKAGSPPSPGDLRGLARAMGKVIRARPWRGPPRVGLVGRWVVIWWVVTAMLSPGPSVVV